MMPNPRQNKRARGTGGENYAARMLTKNGYALLCRNYTAPCGEVDLILTKENFLCFVEVKLRSLSSGEVAASAVDKEKLERICGCIEHFYSEYKDNRYVSSLKPRIDVVEIYTSKGIVKKFNHIIGVQDEFGNGGNTQDAF